jgi:SAM-dependent methyltransferase
MTAENDAVVNTAQAYEASADAWRAYHGEHREAWGPSYDRFIGLVAPEALVLDLGCGPGLDGPALGGAGLRCAGLDISSRLLQVARSQPALAGRLVLGDLRCLPYAETSFDAVWAGGSLHHVLRADIRGALAEVSRVTRAGGIFMASVERGDGEGYAVAMDNVADARWYAYYEPDEWRALLRRNGFEMVDALMGGPSEHSHSGFFAMFARKR